MFVNNARSVGAYPCSGQAKAELLVHALFIEPSGFGPLFYILNNMKVFSFHPSSGHIAFTVLHVHSSAQYA